MQLDGDVVRFTPEEEARMGEELGNPVLAALRAQWECIERLTAIVLGTPPAK